MQFLVDSGRDKTIRSVPTSIEYSRQEMAIFYDWDISGKVHT